MGSIQPILYFSVFLCDFRVFRVMIRSAKTIPYKKSKYIQKSRPVIPGSLESFTPPARKSEIWSQTVCLVANQRFAQLRASLMAHPASAKVVDFIADLPHLRPVLWTGPRPQEA